MHYPVPSPDEVKMGGNMDIPTPYDMPLLVIFVVGFALAIWASIEEAKAINETTV